MKPQNFFEPIWDLVPDDMRTEAAKSGLADELDEKIVLGQDQKNELMCILHPPTFRLIYIMKRSGSEFYRHLIEHDTAFLVKMETIDYSMLLGRYPIEVFHDKPDPSRHRDPLVLPKKDHFVSGVRSADRNWVYKMCILWNVEQLHPKLIKATGLALPEQTVTAEPDRYRKEFLKYVSCPFIIETCS